MSNGLKELHGIQIKDVLAFGVVAKDLMIPGKAKDVENIEGGCAEDITLKGNPVPIPSNHLEGRFDTHSLRWMEESQAAEAGYRCLVIGDTNRIHVMLDELAFLVILGLLPLGGPHSEVTARCPALSIFSSLLGVLVSLLISHPPLQLFEDPQPALLTSP